uniref:Uncharacterized protein n=1 Tax=Fagus sylvatica TaxID=28930 RepID=A0A2N9GBB2_FAGSY
MNVQNKLQKLNVLDKLDKGIQAQNEKLDKLDKLDKISSDIAQMNAGVADLMTYLRERDGNPNSSRVNNVGNVQGSIVPVIGTVTRNIEVGQSFAENQNQTYNNERPAGYPDSGLNMYRDEVRVEIPEGEPYFEQPRVEVNKETYAKDAFRTEFNRNAHQMNDGAYRPPKGVENEVRRGIYNFHDNDRNVNYRNDRNFRNDRNERNDRNDRNRFQEPQRNEFEEPNQNVRQEIGNNAIGGAERKVLDFSKYRHIRFASPYTIPPYLYFTPSHTFPLNHTPPPSVLSNALSLSLSLSCLLISLSVFSPSSSAYLTTVTIWLPNFPFAQVSTDTPF